MSRGSWKTTPISGRGARTTVSSMNTSPRDGASRPQTMRSSVLLPQPLVPTRPTISPRPTSRLTPWRAVTPVSKRLATRLMRSILALLALRLERVLPADQAVADHHEDDVGQLAEQREQHEAADDELRSAGLLAVEQQIAEPLAGAHQFGRNDEHPAESKPAAQAHEVGGEGGRQQDAAHEPPPGEAIDAADLDQLAVHALDPAHQVEIDREEDADRDQRHLRQLVD